MRYCNERPGWFHFQPGFFLLRFCDGAILHRARPGVAPAMSWQADTAGFFGLPAYGARAFRQSYSTGSRQFVGMTATITPWSPR
jgi:hypothetical protein